AGHLSVHIEGAHPVDVPFLFERPQEHVAPAAGASLAAHVVLVLALFLLVKYAPHAETSVAILPEKPNDNIIWLSEPGPGGAGGGVYRPGNGVTQPQLLREVKPAYTSDAMRAKVQGSVWVETIVQKDGSVGDVQVIRSLDPTFGLDQEAIKAAKQWRFRPC